MLLSGNLQGAQHLGIPVLDIDCAKEWYTKVCGFEVVHEPKVATDEGDIHVAFLKLGNLSLECYQIAGAGRNDIASREHGHIDHFSIDATDINQAMADALAAGATLDDATPDGPVLLDTFFSQGINYVVFTGPTGEKVEFSQRLELEPERRQQNLYNWAHLGIPVTDLATSRNFYQQLGFDEIMYAEIPVDSEAVKASMMQKEDFVIELYQLVGAEREEIGTRKDGHIDHIALNVADIHSAYAELRSAGLTILEDAPIALDFWDNGCKYFNVRGPDGEKLEFNQIM